jgi:V/A-type H+-transporting ATPase subunit I
MRFSELAPLSMARVAVVLPRARLRDVLIELADSGSMEIDPLGRDERDTGPAAELARQAPGDATARLSRNAPDLDRLRELGAWDLIAGEAELSRRERDAIEHGPAAVLAGWVPSRELETLAERLTRLGASLVRLPRPRGTEPPTHLLDRGLRRSLRPLVSTYAVVPYEDVDPSLFAGITYVLMFGMMFGDVGHGLLLAALGGMLARSRAPRLQSLRKLWFFPVGAGLVAAAFGLLYGEAFGPTGLVRTLWLSPLEEPVRLLVAALGLGALLIGISYLIGIVNRWREGGAGLALYAVSGVAGAALFVGAALVAMAFAGGSGLLGIAGGVLASAGLLLTYIGLHAGAGESGAAAVAEALVELFDTVIRICANVISFARLAAFGMTHAALGFAVWEGTRALWGPGPEALAAIVLFLVGNAVAFALEALVAGVQALRLEYYELFSRLFSGQGRLFEPWHVPVASEESP